MYIWCGCHKHSTWYDSFADFDLHTFSNPCFYFPSYSSLRASFFILCLALFSVVSWPLYHHCAVKCFPLLDSTHTHTQRPVLQSTRMFKHIQKHRHAQSHLYSLTYVFPALNPICMILYITLLVLRVWFFYTSITNTLCTDWGKCFIYYDDREQCVWRCLTTLDRLENTRMAHSLNQTTCPLHLG